MKRGDAGISLTGQHGGWDARAPLATAGRAKLIVRTHQDKEARAWD
jgi:hypothetical protein